MKRGKTPPVRHIPSACRIEYSGERMNKEKLKRISAAFCMTAAIGLGLTAAVYRASGCFDLFGDSAMAAQRMAFSNGSAAMAEENDEAPADDPVPAEKPLSVPKEAEAAPVEKPAKTTHSGDTYPVTEIDYSPGNMSYDNICVSNNTPYDPDIGALLDAELPFDVEDNRTVQVLIYHTHTCECYMDEDAGYYYDDWYPRSTDGDRGVVAVGDRIAEELKKNGIGVVHDATLHDYPSYDGSYGRSWDTIAAYKEKYPGIVVTLDIHRDAMTADDGTKYKPTFTYDGKKAAQIMIMSGWDDSGEFPFWEDNLNFALKLQKECEDSFPGMTRALDFGEFSYNMDFNNGSLLIEVGTDANTVDEATFSGELLGKALSSVLQKG